jgi:hypothetical protein
MKCSLCKELLKDLGYWIYMKTSYGTVNRAAQMRVCSLCYEDSRK